MPRRNPYASPADKAMAHMRNIILPRIMQPATPPNAPAAKAPAKKKKPKRAKAGPKPKRACSQAGRRLAKCK